MHPQVTCSVPRCTVASDGTPRRKNYCAAHREQKHANYTKYRAAHLEHLRAYQRDYKAAQSEAQREYLRAYQRARNARLKAAR